MPPLIPLCEICKFAKWIDVFGRDIALKEIICRAPMGTVAVDSSNQVIKPPVGRIVNKLQINCPFYRLKKP